MPKDKIQRSVDAYFIEVGFKVSWGAEVSPQTHGLRILISIFPGYWMHDMVDVNIRLGS